VSALAAATRAELSKIRTWRRLWLVTGLVLGLQLLVGAQAMGLYAEAVAGITPDGRIEIFAGVREPAYPAMTEALVASSLQMSIFLPVLTAVLAGREVRGRQLGLCLLAVPRRGRLLTAKILAAAAYLLATALLIAAISSVFTHLAVRDWDPGLLVSAGALRGQAEFLAFAVLLGVTTYAIAVAVRRTLVAILAALALITVTMTQVLAGRPGLDALFPLSAGRNLLLNPAATELTAGPWHALLVLVGWALVTSLIAGVSLARRDAR